MSRRGMIDFYHHRRRQRGLSLVEVGLVVIVIGLLVGASVIPFAELIEDDIYKYERKRMETIHNAITGYALTHRTGGGSLILENRTEPLRITRVQFQLPSGRPYLPCPDVNGDGYEDRSTFDSVGLVADSISVPLSIVLITTLPPNQAAGQNRMDGTSQNDLLFNGNCVVNRGVLPWKTLGVQPTDYWGNYYTYQVDDVIANALVGFSQDTIIDEHDIRMPLVFGEVVAGSPGQPREWFYNKRKFLKHNVVGALADYTRIQGPSHIIRGVVPLPGVTYVNHREVVVVCDGARRNAICQVSRQDSTEGQITVVAEPQPLKAGRQLTTPELYLPRRNYFQGEILEGLPYVIVSQGQNGHGAISRYVNEINFKEFFLNQIFTPADAFTYECQYPVNSGGVNNPAYLNIRLDDRVGSVPYESYSQEATNFPFPLAPSPNLYRCLQLRLDGYSNLDYSHSQFITRDRAGQSSGQVSVPDYRTGAVVNHPLGFDDIVMWSTSQELMQRLMDAGVFPLADASFPLLVPSR